MLNLKIIKTAFLFSLFTSVVLQADIKKCTSIKDIDQFCQDNKNKKITYVTDLDDTVAKRMYECSSLALITHIMSVPFTSINFFSSPIVSVYDSLHYVQRLEPMEAHTLPFLKQAQQDKLRIIVLTARPINVADQTEKQLNALGIDFSINNEDLQENQKIGDLAVYRKGIIYCGTQEKGPTIAQFFEQNNMQPEHMLYVEDKDELAQSVDTAMKTASIPCNTYLYNPATAA